MKQYFARKTGPEGKAQIDAMKLKNEEIQSTPIDEYIPDELPDSYLKKKNMNMNMNMDMNNPNSKERKLQLKQFIKIKRLS